MEFKIGDRVRIINMNNVPKTYGDMTNKTGVIKWNTPSEWGNAKYGIAFEDVKNHSSEKGYFYFSKDNLELAHNIGSTIVTLKPRDESIGFGFESPYLDLSSLILSTDSKEFREFKEKLNKELTEYFNAFPNDGISAKNGGKNSKKFTFYVTEGTRVDKSCNGTIPTMTTMVSYIDKYGCIMKGTATCDKADYDERQGVLEAFANATCGNDFYKAYAEAVKEKKHRDIADRTCTYCGKVFDTIEEKQEHEAWHVERRKARHERYLLRKRAKEIAFEEAAQKMAKEMMNEKK